MSLKKFRPLITVFTTAIVGIIIHKTLFYFMVPKVYEKSFIYSIPLLYAFFAIISAIIVFILIKVNYKKSNLVGFVFLVLTTLKMGIVYLFLRPILNFNLPKTPTEKINFLVIFIYFLAIETIVTIRILNNKQ